MEQEVIRIDNDNFFCDKNKHKCTPSKSSEFHLKMKDGSILRVPNSCIENRKFRFGNTEYTIKDREMELIKAGYVVRKGKYEKHFQMNSIEGMSERESLFENIFQCVDGYFSYTRRGINITLNFDEEPYEYIVNFDTINSVVTQNQERKINGQTYLPFDRNIDKYNSAYLSVFSNNPGCSDLPNKILYNIIQKLNNMGDQCIYRDLRLRRGV